jgi:prenyltransferase beta subunit
LIINRRKKMAIKVKRIAIVWLTALSVFALGLQVTYGAALRQANAHTAEANKALEWMKTQQQPDGSFAGFGAGSTVDAVLALIAAGAMGHNFDAYNKAGNTPITFIQNKGSEIAKTPGGAGKLIIAVAVLNMNANATGGVDSVEIINSAYDADSGHYGKDAIGHAFAMLGLKAAQQAIPTKAVDFLRGIQTPEGGWAFSGDTKAGGADTNTTSVVVQALVAAGVPSTDTAMQKARSFLLSQQNASDGGFPYQQGGEFGSDSDVNSTAYAVQALHYLGADETRGIDFILSMQKPNGAFRWMASEQDDNAGATYQAIPAILGATLVEPKGAMPIGIDPGGFIVTPTGMPSTGNDGLPTLPTGIVALALLAVGAGVILNRRVTGR